MVRAFFGFLLAYTLICSCAAQSVSRTPSLSPLFQDSQFTELALLDDCYGCDRDPDNTADSTTRPDFSPPADLASPIIELSPSQPDLQHERVDWGGLGKASSMYLGIMHSYRIATEPSTRAGLHNSVVGGYFKALGAMHGWSDGDTYYENYLGHPIEGAASAYIFINNDPKYSGVEFGASRDYWMGRFRAYAYAWAFSEQFEVGLMSEASIGQIQRYCCAYGFVDHVITPNMGMIWVVGGDALDRFVGRKIEDRTNSPVIRALVLAGLNPPLSFANMMSLHYPWHRANRPGVHDYHGDLYYRPPLRTDANLSTTPKFEITAAMPSLTRYGNVSCIGGSGVAGYRIAEQWQWTAEVGGCTLGNDLPKGWSGDSLMFMTGPQWVTHTQSKWSPHFHFRVGGQKITEDYCMDYGPVRNGTKEAQPCKSDPSGYPQHYEATGPAISLGSGLDLRLNRALEVRIANLDYIHSWMGQIHGTDFNQGIRFTMGLGLKIGTW